MKIGDKVIAKIKKDVVDSINIPAVIYRTRKVAYTAIAARLTEATGIVFRWNASSNEMVLDRWSFGDGSIAREIDACAKGEAENLLAKLKDDKSLFALTPTQLNSVRSHAKKVYVEKLREYVGEAAADIAAERAKLIAEEIFSDDAPNTQKPATGAG